MPGIIKKPLWQVWHKLLIKYDEEGAVLGEPKQILQGSLGDA